MDDATRKWLGGGKRYFVRRGDDAYPELLAEIGDPPEHLYIEGDPDALHLPCLAIVGSRNPTRSGLRNAYEFAQHLGRAGFCIVSGLAQGIDAAAHRGALAAGAKTVALLGHGIDRVYPSANLELAREIAAHGALVSEFPLGMHPDKSLFPQRNRLISGLSFGTIVVEAARRSGSLITARCAGEQGREVFALPGSIHNPLARGCHYLIRQGAKLVETADDILEELRPLLARALQNSVESTGSVENMESSLTGHDELLECIAHDPVSTDDIVRQSGLTIEEVSSMLLILELEGKVEKLSGGRYSLLN